MIASGRSSSRHHKRPRRGASEDNNSVTQGTGNSASSRYDVLDRSGEGTLFVVYRVRDKNTQSLGALKALKGVYSRHEHFANAITNAARATSGLRHPNIATLIEVGREEDTAFVVEEWLPGGTLEKRLRRAPFGRVEITSLAIQILDGLIALHDNGIAHGDVRPRQILFDSGGHAKLNDIGFSAAYPASEMTMTDVQLEAAYYQAPERWNGQTASPRADLYALGVVLYRAATGRVPFDGTSPLSIAARHRNDSPLRPRQFNPHCPPELEEFILRLLEKEASSRFSSAREALAVIAPEHQPIPAQRVRVAKPEPEQKPAAVEPAPITPIAAPPVVVAPVSVAPVAVTPVIAPQIPEPVSETTSPIEAASIAAPSVAQSTPVVAAAPSAATSSAPEPEVLPSAVKPRLQRPAPNPHKVAPTAALADDSASNAEPFDAPAPDKKRHGRREMLGAFLALFWTLVAANLLIGICYGAYVFWMKEAPPEVRVPRYVGLNQNDAKRLLEKSGLQMRVGKEAYNPKKPEGTILNGDPTPGKLVRKGRVILVTVSRGEEPVRMVDFSELTLEQARVIINRHGMRLGQVAEQYHERVPKGFICGQYPEPGESFRRSEPINLVVSRGPQPSSVAPDPASLPVAPNAPRLPEEDTATDVSPSTPAGQVEETLISRGAIVSVALPSGGGPQEVKIVVRDAEGEYTAYQQTHEAGDVIDKPIQVLRPQGSTALVRVYVGGRLLDEIRV